MEQREFASLVLERLTERYGKELHTELKHKNLTELFVAVFLSPQCADRQVNKVTPALFKKYTTFDDYANSDIRTLMRYLSGLNYYKTKARHLKMTSKMIMDQYDGEIPRTITQLTELPGVGRKVANVILNESFSINEGIAVDTHCITVSRRLHLSRHKDAKRIEIDLMRKIPREQWQNTSNLLITLGRDTCQARKKECHRCALMDICPSSDAKYSKESETAGTLTQVNKS